MSRPIARARRAAPTDLVRREGQAACSLALEMCSRLTRWTHSTPLDNAWRAGLLVLALLGVAAPAAAAPIVQRHVQALDFVAPSQSFWGGATGFSFGTKGSQGWSALNFNWDIGASTGMVSGQFNGDLLIDHDTMRWRPGTVNLQLGFTGDAGGGQISSSLGAWARAGATLAGVDVSLMDYGFGLNPDASFSPSLGQAVASDDFDALAGVDASIGIFSAGVSLGIEQTNSFIANAINGAVAYSKRGTGLVQLAPFSLGSGGAQLSPHLDAEGLWDFWLTDLALDNSFSTDFDAELVFFERHVDGIQWCSKRIWGFTIKWPCGLTFDENEFTLASLGLYDGTPFGLDFDNTAQVGRFTIQVVPEPSSAALVCLALAVLVGRQAARVSPAGGRPPGGRRRRPA